MSDLLNVERLGEGPDLVLLHGWGQSSAALKPLGELLSCYFTVHLIDLPGFGKSSPPTEVWNSFQYADRLHSYLEEQKIGSAIFVGHSFGGKTALSFAKKYPEKTVKLVLMAASGLKRQRSWFEKLRFYWIKLFGKAIKVFDRLSGFKLFESKFAPRYGSADYKKASAMMRAVLVKSVNEDLTEEISKIQVPTLLLWGEEDSETPPEMAYRMKNLIANSQIVVFPGKGHQLYEDCGSHLCAAYMKRFLCI